MTDRCPTPRNDQRPNRWPCSADSSRNEGPSPCSFRYAETGVSQSSMKVCRSSTSVWSRASARTSSRLGLTSSPAGSATTAIQLLEHVPELEPARSHEDRQVVEDVGRLLAQPPVAPAVRGLRGFGRLLADLRADAPAVGEPLPRLAAPRAAPRA